MGFIIIGGVIAAFLLLCFLVWLISMLLRIKRSWNANKNSGAGLPKLTAKQFEKFYMLCSNQWNWPKHNMLFSEFDSIGCPYYECPNPRQRTRFWKRSEVWFKNSWEMYKAWRFYKQYNMRLQDRKNQEQEVINTANFLEIMQAEVNSAQETANRMMSENEVELRAVLARLEKWSEGGT